MPLNEDNRCEQCVEMGEMSRVYIPQEPYHHTDGITPPFYDEAGILQGAKPYDVTIYQWRCSKGHYWMETCQGDAPPTGKIGTLCT